MAGGAIVDGNKTEFLLAASGHKSARSRFGRQEDAHGVGAREGAHQNPVRASHQLDFRVKTGVTDVFRFTSVP